MNLQLETTAYAVRKTRNQAGFSLIGALILVFFIAFVAAGAMHLIRYRYAALGFILTVILALIIVSLPDMKRYIRISTM